MRLLYIVVFLLPHFALAASNDVVLDTDLGPLAGTIVMPESGEPTAVTLIISGSGPTDRNGNTRGLPGNNDSLRMLAESLSNANVASLRFDKRLIGESASGDLNEADIRFDTYVSDARSWLEFLDARFDLPTYVIGHSEGSLIGLLAAKSANVTGVISIAGPGKRASDLLREQLGKQLPPNLLEVAEGILRELEEGRTVQSPPPALNALFRESVQPYLISWFQYDPQTIVADLDKPLLLIFGSTDIQVHPSDGELLKSSNDTVELLVIEGMNHVLKTVGPDRNAQVRSYSDPSLPISDEIVPAIEQFMQKHN